MSKQDVLAHFCPKTASTHKHCVTRNKMARTPCDNMLTLLYIFLLKTELVRLNEKGRMAYRYKSLVKTKKVGSILS